MRVILLFTSVMNNYNKIIKGKDYYSKEFYDKV